MKVRQETTWRRALLVALLTGACCGFMAFGASAGAPRRVYLPLVRRAYPPFPGVPLLGPVQDPEGDGNYNVYWSPSDRATAYELHEKWQDGEWYAAYRGANRQIELRNRPAGTFWYRCRAENSWGQSDWSNWRTITVPGTPPSTINTPSSSRVSAGGKAVLHVVNDCPHYLRIDLTGPGPRLMELLKCDTCKVYSMIGPFFCPTSGRPSQEVQLDPGPYRVFVSVSDPAVRPYIGHWQLQSDRRYFVCFYIVRSWGSGAPGAVTELVASGCPQ
jgi:hypothetical protein